MSIKEKILNSLMAADTHTSGEKLSELLGVSRSAIWKAIKKLKEEGYEIDSVRNKGYLLLEETTNISQEGLRTHLNQSSIFQDIFVYDSLDSTNSEAKRLKADQKMHQGLVIANDQTSGKGRRGRTWLTQKDVNIMMTLVLEPDLPPEKASMLTLVAALAVAEAIEEQHKIDIGIKWPNDLVVDGKKVCGILTEMSAQMDYINYVLVGIGINVNQSEIPVELENLATSLSNEIGASINRMQLIADVSKRFEDLYDRFLEKQDFSFLKERYEAKCVNVDSKIKVESYKEVFEGVGLGINNQGHLMVKKNNGETVTVNAGEVSVRGLYGYVD